MARKKPEVGPNSQPVVQRTGRPPRAREVAALEAVNAAMPPERITKLIEDTLGWIEQHKSVNGALKLLQLTLAYQLGEPVKRVVSTRMKVEDLLNQVRNTDDDSFDDAIEAIYSNSDK